jgi:hypothetical protein
MTLSLATWPKAKLRQVDSVSPIAFSATTSPILSINAYAAIAVAFVYCAPQSTDCRASNTTSSTLSLDRHLHLTKPV